MSKTYIFDIETFANTFSLVAVDKEGEEWKEFVIFEDDRLRQAQDLFYFFYEKPKFIGYNNLGFDGQVIEEIYNKEIIDGREIYRIASEIIATRDSHDLPYRPWDFQFKHLDLMAMNNYSIYGKPTSLKWLEFSMRRNKILDMPKHHTSFLTESDIDDLIRYNKEDVKSTFDFYQRCQKAIDMRTVLVNKYNDEMIFNQPNSSIGEKIVLYTYSQYTGVPVKKLKTKYTKRKEIAVKDIILPYIKFDTPILKSVKEDFERLVLKADSSGKMVFKNVYENVIQFQDMTVTYALGGIHGCVSSGIFKSDDKYIIRSYDVKGMYPNLAKANGFYPAHLGPEFVEVYKIIGEERDKHPKGSELNKAYKESDNSVYGKSNSRTNNFLKDPQYTVQTTINGQLVLTMLGERLSQLGEFIMWNTDGGEIIIPRELEEEYDRICAEWSEMTGVTLEHDSYETMWVRDVNNYIAKYTNGKVKRKGFFKIYEDYTLDQNPSGLIIPEAIQAYFLEGKDPSTTILEWDNIHDFCYGIKGSGSEQFEYWLLDIQDNIIQNIDKRKERALRYYCSKDGVQIMKFYRDGKKDGNLESVANTKGLKIKLLMNIADHGATVYRKVRKGVYETRYEDLDYDYYIREAWKWIHVIENKQTTEEEE